MQTTLLNFKSERCWALAFATLLAAGASAQAQSADALIDKLVDKGILTVKEANDLREETDKNFTQAYSVKSGLPDWVTSFKINGDFRGRYESFHFDNSGGVDRTRFRYRARLGFTALMADGLEVGLRLASGEVNGDPLSTNQTLQDNGSKKSITTDLAYAKWTSVDNAEWAHVLTLGKMENPFAFPSTMLFDKDYTPEGIADELTYRFNNDHSLKLTAGAFLLDELSADSNDPWMQALQLRWNATWSPKLSTTLGASWLNISNPELLTTANVPNVNRGNTRTAAGVLVNDYHPYYVDAGITYTLDSMPLHTGPFPISVTGDYLHNPGASDENNAWSAGVTFGKAGKRKTWQVDYRFTEQEADSWFEELTESDFGAYYQTAPVGGSTGYQSGTNVKGHFVKANYSPYDSLTLSVACFFTELVKASPANSESGATRVQMDAVWKF